MNTFAILVACFAGILAYAFLFAGIVGLQALDEKERAELDHGVAHRGFRGVMERQILESREATRWSRLAENWRQRPEVRRLIWFGLVSTVITIVSASCATLSR